MRSYKRKIIVGIDTITSKKVILEYRKAYPKVKVPPKQGDRVKIKINIQKK